MRITKEVANDLSKAGYAVRPEDVGKYVDEAILTLYQRKEISLPLDSENFDDMSAVIELAKHLYWNDRGELDYYV